MLSTKLIILFALLVVWPGVLAQAKSSEVLENQFRNPPREARPWVYWVWVGDTTREALTRDLEEMKAKGIAGCILYEVQSGRGHNWWDATVVRSGKDYKAVPTADFPNPYYSPVPNGPLATWSAHWRDLVCFASKECARLGIDFVISDGLANTSGNISEEFGEQQLVWTEVTVAGGQNFDVNLPEYKLNRPPDSFPHPKWKNYHRDIAVFAFPDREGFSTNEVIDLTTKMIGGRLRWKAPSGKWKIIRFAQVPTGAHNEWGYYTDSMSAEAMDKTWEVTMAPLLKQMPTSARRGLKGIEDDSWESGKTTWTKLLLPEFKKRRGYHLTPYLPMLAGFKMCDADMRERVQRDYALTISDLIAENHYGRLAQLANQNGLLCFAEAAGPHLAQADLLKNCSKVDIAMAEFWMPSAHRPTMDSRFLLRNAATANHVYGKNITMCESFTSLGPEWEESPFTMKPVADQAFCDGLNKICVHAFSQSPNVKAKPGYVYCAGTHYEPGITWWEQTPALNTYLSRCCAMLQAGRFVADAIFYYGDNIGRGEQRKTALPMLGEGFDHDNCNSDVLRTRMQVRDRRIVLPDGMSYRVLVLPEKSAMPLEDLKKIANLIKDGATVIGPRPTGLAGVAQADELKSFDELVGELWGCPEKANGVKNIGKGGLISTRTPSDLFRVMGVPPDFEASGVTENGTIDWIHRQTDEAEIYFVASRWEQPQKISAAFRVERKQPELWDPVTGEIREATAFSQKDGRTIVPLEFGPCGSVFVVFRKPISKDVAGTANSNHSETRPLVELNGPWRVNFDPKWGGPAQVVVDQLIDWTNSPDPRIRYYSGSATYHKTFSLSPGSLTGEKILLDLGDVEVVASVRLNGRDLGVVWTKPARVDISNAVKAGENVMDVTVVNLWPNRLIHDESLPKQGRLTETDIHKFAVTSPLLSSGLIGPVKLWVETK